MCFSAMVEQDLRVLEKRWGAKKSRESRTGFTGPEDETNPLPGRIYPGSWAPVLTLEEGRLVTRLMRYSVRPSTTGRNPPRYTPYNARRDNLRSPFWAHCFGQHHGFVVLRSFFEWVTVSDVISAGTLNLEEIRSALETSATSHSESLFSDETVRVPLSGVALERFKSRKIVIEFYPSGQTEDLLVPVIYSVTPRVVAGADYGFALVTDEPPPEVEQAGHDRCPVFLDPQGALEWTTGAQVLGPEALDEVLERRISVTLRHRQDLHPNT